MFGVVCVSVAAEIATSPACDLVIVPGGLAVPAVQESHSGGIKVDQVQLLAAMRIVAGVTGDAPIVVHV